MSSYNYAGRPLPHIRVPRASANNVDRPPPVPPKPVSLSPTVAFPNPDFNYVGSTSTNWEQYAEAANAQYDADEGYYTGDRYGLYEDGHGYEYRYETGGDLTPNAVHQNGNGASRVDEDYFSNPYSPSSSPRSDRYQYHMHEAQAGYEAGPITTGQQRRSSVTGSLAVASYDPGGGSFKEQSYTVHGDDRRSSYVNDSQRPASFTEGCSPITSNYDPEGATFAFPDPQMHRSLSHRAHAPSLSRQSISDVGPAVQLSRASSYASSYAPSYAPSFQDSTEALTEELSALTLESEEGLRRFQAGELAPTDEEWHKLVPETAREALGEREVQRQSILFEIFKSERDYVRDLETVFEVIVDPLRTSNVFHGEEQAADFIRNVFWNLHDVLSYHQRMLGSLFARQRDQHPLIQSVSDIILETALQFMPAYDDYIKHYPLSEARHRKEHKQNPAYRTFLQNVSQDPRIRKRDLVTFISRPVTRLPRLSLLLETLLKKTDENHPDQESTPLIIGILGDFVKSTQPGIEAAESRVKFWNVMENLVFRGGEIIDLDEQDESRTLVHSQTLGRRIRSEMDWHGWNDFFVVLLDHYLLITREWKRPNGVKYEVASRPIPLEFLRLGQFDQPPETRKDRSEEGGLLDSLRYQTRQQYPFTIYHADAKSTRRYTLYTNTEGARRKWRDALAETIALHQARRDANKWFAPSTIEDGVFRMRSVRVPLSSTELFTGAITAAAVFASGGKIFLIVGCEGGVYASMRGDKSFRRVLTFQNASYIAALQDYRKIVILADNNLLSYSMDIMARVSQGTSPPKSLDASMEKLSGQDNAILAKAGIVRDRTVVVYVAKSFSKTTVQALEVLQQPIISRAHPSKSSSFRSFGSPFYVPRNAYEITLLSKTIATAGDKGVTIVDPTNLSSSAILVVPDCSAASTDLNITDLKSRCDNSKPLGIARVDKDENMVVYEDFGCYVDRHGLPRRQGFVVRWECKAIRFVDRREHILLFGSEFVEVRLKATGRLVQVIKGGHVRLLNAGFVSHSDIDSAADAGQDIMDNVPILMTRTGKRNDVHGQSLELLELLKTSPIVTSSVPSSLMSSAPNSDEMRRVQGIFS